MPHPLVDQLRFTRDEWRRGLDGVSEADGAQRVGPLNSIGWIVGHLAWQEHRYWLELAQGRLLVRDINDLYAYGSPASTPSLTAMLALWHKVTHAVDPYLDALDTRGLEAPLLRDGRDVGQSVGSAMRRMTYHYWYHLGEIQAIRQWLGHTGLPEYVGPLERDAPYRPEA